MTLTETASALRRIADGMDRVVKKIGRNVNTGQPKASLEGDLGVGAAALLCYLRDLVTATGKEMWDTGELLVLLETISRDAELFPCGVAAIMWQADTEETDEES